MSELVILNCIPKEFQSIKTDNSNSETAHLHIRVTVEEKEKMINSAKEAGLNLSRYVRNCCLDSAIVVIPNMKEFTRELNKIGVNLNQITRLVNQGLIQSPDIFEAKEELKKIYKELTKLNKKTQPRR